MKRKYFFLINGLWLTLLAACGGATGGTETGNATPGDVAYAVADSIDTVTGLLNVESDLTTARLPFEKISPPRARPRWSLFPSAFAAPPCVETAECNEAEHSATFIKNFSEGCDTGDGLEVEGRRYISWFNMGDGACNGPTEKPNFLLAIQGQGARQIRSTDTVTPEGACGIPQTPLLYAFDDGARLEITQCARLDYTGFSSTAPGEGTVTESLNLALGRRIFFLPDGSKLYDHSILTPAPLQVDIVKVAGQGRPNKLIHSGSVRVVHNLAQYRVDTEYQEVFWDYNECRCYPVSGTVNFTVTSLITGQEQGQGSLTFDKDATGACRVAMAKFQGQSLNVLLHACRGF